MPRQARAGWLFRAMAVVELVSGFGFLIAPEFQVRLLLGEPLTSVTPWSAIIMTRVAGAALIAIGVACWFESRNRSDPSPGLLGGLLTYNVVVTILLLHAAIFLRLGGIILWPSIAIHFLFAIWSSACLRLRDG